MGGSERGAGTIRVDTPATDARALLDAPGIERAHVLGYSLDGAIAQQLVLNAPERVASLVLLGAHRRLPARPHHRPGAPVADRGRRRRAGRARRRVPPELLDDPEFGALVERLLPLFPQTAVQLSTTSGTPTAPTTRSTDALGGERAEEFVPVVLQFLDGHRIS